MSFVALAQGAAALASRATSPFEFMSLTEFCLAVKNESLGSVPSPVASFRKFRSEVVMLITITGPLTAESKLPPEGVSEFASGVCSLAVVTLAAFCSENSVILRKFALTVSEKDNANVSDRILLGSQK